MPEVVCIGLLVADVVAGPLRAYPAAGRLSLVEQMELHTGGCAANSAIALAKLGVSTGVMGKVGDDTFGRFIVDRLRTHGIDTAGITRSVHHRTSATWVCVDENKERSFIHYTGANADLSLEDINRARLLRHRALHLGGALLLPRLDGAPMADLLRSARAGGLKTSLDTVWDPTDRWLETLQPCLPFIDYFLPSYEEARRMSGRQDPETIADFFLARGVGVVGLKLGAGGSLIKTNTQTTLRIPSYNVPVVDTTGAGDGFAAGFITGALSGWDLEKTGRFANAVGACCISALGATEGLRNRAQVESLVRGS